MASSLSDDALAGAFSGFVGRIITAPFDVVKIRQQLLYNSIPIMRNPLMTMSSTFKQVIQEEGILALWKGNLSATILWVSYSAFQFGVYGFLKEIDAHLTPIDRRNDAFTKLCRMVFAGGVSGMVATIATYPFDIMRTQFALQGPTKFHKSLQSYVLYTYKTYGLRGFFVGLGPAVVGITPYVGLNFGLYEGFKSLCHIDYQQEPNKLTVVKIGLVGGLAGGISKFLVYPLDTLKKRLQAQSLQSSLKDTMVGKTQYAGMIDCITKIYKTEGFQGFYKGIVPTIMKSVSSVAITFMAYEVSELTEIVARRGHERASLFFIVCQGDVDHVENRIEFRKKPD